MWQHLHTVNGYNEVLFVDRQIKMIVILTDFLHEQYNNQLFAMKLYLFTGPFSQLGKQRSLTPEVVWYGELFYSNIIQILVTLHAPFKVGIVQFQYNFIRVDDKELTRFYFIVACVKVNRVFKCIDIIRRKTIFCDNDCE